MDMVSYSKCFDHCRKQIDDVAAAIVVRGGPQEDAPAPNAKNTKPMPKGKSKTDKQNLKKLAEQQLWLRQTITSMKETLGNTAFVRGKVKEMEAELARIDDTIEKVMVNSTTTDSLMSSTLVDYSKSVAKFLKKALEGKVKSVTVSTIEHSASDGKSYSTQAIIMRDLKAQDRTWPWMVLYLSETQERNEDKRRRFVTALSSVNTTFTPKTEFKNQNQLLRQIQMFLTGKNVILASDRGTTKLPANINLTRAVKGVKSSKSENGKILITVDSKADPKKVAFESQKTLLSLMRKANPNFDGNIQATITPATDKKPAYVTLVSNVKRRDHTQNYKSNMQRFEEEASVKEDTASEDNQAVAIVNVEPPAEKDVASRDLDSDMLYQQLGGSMFKTMTGCGPFFKSKDKSVTFAFKGNRKISHAKFTLNDRDLYDIDFLKFTMSGGMKPVVSKKDVQAGQIRQIFETVTGLRTSL